MDYKKFGKQVKKARKEKGYTQSDLAEMTGYSVQHISHIETGNTKLSVELLIELANALNASLDQLLADSLIKTKLENYLIMLDPVSDKEKQIIVNVVNELQRSLREAKK